MKRWRPWGEFMDHEGWPIGILTAMPIGYWKDSVLWGIGGGFICVLIAYAIRGRQS